MLPISRRKGEPGVAPTVANAQDRSYPLTRALQVYTAGAPEAPAARYLDWMMSPDGQKIVVELGYVAARW